MVLAKAFYAGIDDSQAIRITFLRAAAQELHSKADAQNRLLQIRNDLIEFFLPEMPHRSSGFTHPGKNNPVGRKYLARIIGDPCRNTGPLKRKQYRTDISCIVFYHFY